MSASIFDKKEIQPDINEYFRISDKRGKLLMILEQFLDDDLDGFEREWKFYGKKAGWTLAYLINNRRVFHLIPQIDEFTVVFVFGKKAITACLESDLPDEIKIAIETAPVYAEGRSVRLIVNKSETVEAVKKLVQIKLSN